MSENRPRARKAPLGQNFLISPTAPKAIADSLGDLSHATVLEVGAGTGAITGELARRAKRLIAVELDADLAVHLQSRFQAEARSSVEVLRQDILTLDLRQLASDDRNRLVVVGNLPYYITSPILLHLLTQHAYIDRAVLMVQCEVADRILAAPGSRQYGLLSATVQMYGDPEWILNLPPEAFSPAPQVHSTVFRLTIRPRWNELAVEPVEFSQFLRQIFAHKRKTLVNNLRAAGYRPPRISSSLDTCLLEHRVRAEELSLEVMAALFHALGKTTED